MASSETDPVDNKKWTTRKPQVRWVFWVALLVAWTFALWMPTSSDFQVSREFPPLSQRFFLSKGLHLVIYAVLGGVIVFLPLTERLKWIPMYFLMLHASLTEVGQLYFFGRTGMVLDVAFNHLGIGCGLGIGTLVQFSRRDLSQPRP